MSADDCNDDVLSALSFYEAVIDGNDVNQRQIVAEANTNGIVKGLLTLLGSCLATMGAQYGLGEQGMIEALRAQYLAHDALSALGGES